MREIKFRAWDKKSKKMRQVVEIVWNTGLYLEPNDNTVKLIWVKGYDVIEQKDIMMKREKDFELMQYTGLHDKNGKEIYEGDVIKDSSGYIGKVIFNTTDVASCGCCYDKFMGTGFLAKDAKPNMGYLDMDERSEVIGNIYDNPELIGE